MHATSRVVSLVFSTLLAAPSLAERAIAYKKYGGDGTPSRGWPHRSEWENKFDQLWDANLPLLKISCAQWSVPNNSDNETDAIKTAIGSGSRAADIPSEFILAIVMQESKGCVRAPTSHYDHDNPGLMQSFEGTATCNGGGVVRTPCEADNIKDQIFEGLGLLGRPFGLRQALTQAVTQASRSKNNTLGVEKFYRAARIYNSGSYVEGDNLGAGIATHCYSSDIANRLLGWTTEASSCDEGSIGSFEGIVGKAEAEGNRNNSTRLHQPTPTRSKSFPNTNGESNSPAPTAPGAASNCKTWYTVNSGDTCASSGHESALRHLNRIDPDCANLWLGYAYCIAR